MREYPKRLKKGKGLIKMSKPLTVRRWVHIFCISVLILLGTFGNIILGFNFPKTGLLLLAAGVIWFLCLWAFGTGRTEQNGGRKG